MNGTVTGTMGSPAKAVTNAENLVAVFKRTNENHSILHEALGNAADSIQLSLAVGTDGVYINIHNPDFHAYS